MRLTPGSIMTGATVALTAAGLLVAWGLAAAIPATLAPPSTARIALVVTYPLVAVGTVLLATHATVADEAGKRPAAWAFVVATLGVLIASVRLAWSVGGQMPRSGLAADVVTVGEVLLTIVVAVLAVSIAVGVVRSTLGASRSDVRLSIGVTLLGLAHVLVGAAGGIGAVDAIASVAAALGSSMFALSSLVLARGTLHAHRVAAADLSDQLRESRAAHLVSRERLHAVANSVAAITSANRLLRAETDLPAEYRRRLQAMLDTEAERLESLLSGRPPAPGSAEADQALGEQEPAVDDDGTDQDGDEAAPRLASVSRLEPGRPTVRAPRPRPGDHGLTLDWTMSRTPAGRSSERSQGGEQRVADELASQ